MKIGTIVMTAREFANTPVALTMYGSVKALRYQEYGTRLLIFGPKARGFWSPACEVRVASRLSDRRLIGICCAMDFESDVWLHVMNIVVVDYDRREMAKAMDFQPFEMSKGKRYRFQYQFLLRGRHEV